MDVSRSVVDASEAGASEMLSEQKQRQAGEGILMSSPDTVQGTGDEEEDDYNDDKESNGDKNKEESEESQMAEAKGSKPSGGEPKGKGAS